MASRQFAHHHLRSLQQLQALVPHACPLLVVLTEGGFRATVLAPPGVELTGRYQVVDAFVRGYVAGWTARLIGEDLTNG